MKTEQINASCISCANYDDEAHICTHESGLLRGIVLSDSMQEAEHDCKEYSEMIFRPSPASILQFALEEFNINVSISVAKHICDNFMDDLIKHGYIENETSD